MELIEQATLVARTLQTLDYLRDYGLVEEGEIAGFLCSQSWSDLKRLMRFYTEQGISRRDIDLGMFVSFEPADAGAVGE